MGNITRPVGIRVFSATKARERCALGEAVSRWIAAESPTIVERIVLQSSDASFHCLTIAFVYINTPRTGHELPGGGRNE